MKVYSYNMHITNHGVNNKLISHSFDNTVFNIVNISFSVYNGYQKKKFRRQLLY